jgi:hypothetical protein
LGVSVVLNHLMISSIASRRRRTLNPDNAG